MIDCHSHILPAMDDGSDSVKTTLRMLREEARQGLDVVVATPHFYAEKEAPETFLERRQASFQQLAPLYEKYPQLPRLKLGAEVRYFEGIGMTEKLDKLQIGDTGLILVEMPFQKWNDHMLRQLDALLLRGLRPILAHVERYPAYHDLNCIRELRRRGCLIQMNADNFLHLLSRRHAQTLFSAGLVDLLGSDCHSMGVRKPNLGEAWMELEFRNSEEVMLHFEERQMALLREG